MIIWECARFITLHCLLVLADFDLNPQLNTLASEENFVQFYLEVFGKLIYIVPAMGDFQTQAGVCTITWFVTFHFYRDPKMHSALEVLCESGRQAERWAFRSHSHSTPLAA